MYETSPATVTAEARDDLRRRIQRTRRLGNPWGGDRSHGIPTAELDALLEYWGGGYNWCEHEVRIRALPWTVSGTSRGPLRSVHRRAADPAAPAVVLLHGWPDSVLRFERLLPLLSDVHVVAPALPGFPFSPTLTAAISAEGIADAVAEAMAGFGYERYVVSGGDVGGTVAELLVAAHPDRVGALHLTNISFGRAATVDPDRLPADALEFLGRLGRWRGPEGGFVAEQSTRRRGCRSGVRSPRCSRASPTTSSPHRAATSNSSYESSGSWSTSRPATSPRGKPPNATRPTSVVPSPCPDASSSCGDSATRTIAPTSSPRARGGPSCASGCSIAEPEWRGHIVRLPGHARLS